MILFALALMASSPSDAAAPSAPTPAANTTATAPAAAPPADDLDKVVCHVDTETGTRLGSHKECHTKREWIQNQQEEARTLGQSTTH
jgi:hypothetical protein